jgi:hypothetical protein
MQIRSSSVPKPKLGLTLQLWERSPSLDSIWSHSVISIEHKPFTMEFGLRCFFIVAILKGDIWRTSDTECAWTWVRRIVGMCDSFLTRIVCVCRNQVSGERSGFWGSFGTTWRFSCVASVSTGWTRSAIFQGRGWNGLEQLTPLVIAHTTQTHWRTDSPSPETMPRISCIYK